MQDLIGDHNVFIRSMASRGSLGGLATATAGVVQALDAADFDTIIIETVGAGQAEVEIAKLAHTTIVVEAPGLGDDVQAIKAGILEIADILVLNKSDRPGVEAAERALTGMLKLGHPLERNFLHHGQTMPIVQSESAEQSPDIWIPSLLRTVSTDGQGIPELLKLIATHKQFLQESGEWQLRDRTRLENELELLLTREMMREWRAESNAATWEATLQAIQERKLSPRNAVNKLLNGLSSA
jgi:LAO/AO transport system kinase